MNKGHRIIKKWFQPYKILEAAKIYFDMNEYIFTGQNKFEKMEQFLNEIQTSSKITFGLYMKNVNKFYVLNLKSEQNENDDIEALENLLLKNQFNSDEKYTDDWIEIISDTNKAISLIDLGKAEAAFIMKV